jgi:trk system potassium uptake protein TrkH
MSQADQGGWRERLGQWLRGDLPAMEQARLRRAVFAALDVLMAVAAATAISALALEYGFYKPPVKVFYLHAIEGGVLAAFVLDRFARLALTEARRAFLRENWIDFAVIAGAALVALALVPLKVKVLPVTALYVAVIQVYILAALALRLAGFHLHLASSRIHPAWLVIASFAAVILFGAGLLMLPKAAPADEPVGFTDAVFTATSATCVTGLVVRDTASGFETFGQAVILVLIQLGGLGIMVFGTVFTLVGGRDLSLRESLLTGQALPGEAVGRIARVAAFAVLTTLAIEAAGATAMYPMWRQVDLSADGRATVAHSVFRSLFHSIAAFCNAGFALQSDNLVSVRNHWPVLGVIAPLIVLGGLGFPVLYDLSRLGRALLRAAADRLRPPEQILTLHSKVVLTVTAVLIFGGAAGLLVIEYQGDRGQTFGAPTRNPDNPYARPDEPALERLPLEERLPQALFQSVTARTAGFNTVSQDALSEGGKLWTCLLMLIGGSPASTAGGMKTATLALVLLAVVSLLRRRQHVEAFRRTIPDGLVRKAVILAALYLAVVVTVTLVLCVTMSGRRLVQTSLEPTAMQLFFEAVSACGTVGLSCGVTESLSLVGKWAVIAGMFVGRLGPLTLLIALTSRLHTPRYTYPAEEVVLG